MSRWLKDWTPDEVAADADPVAAFAEFAQQKLGTPRPTLQQMIVLRKRAKEFFVEYPHLDVRTFCRVVDWCKAKKRRPAHAVTIIKWVRYAWADGYLPELDPENQPDEDTDRGIKRALELEDDERWRRRLMLVQGRGDRAEALADWRKQRSQICLARERDGRRA